MYLFTDKLRSSTAIQRNIFYPIGMLVLLFLTGLTVLIVVQNILELLIGIKALGQSTRVCAYFDILYSKVYFKSFLFTVFFLATNIRNNIVIKAGTNRSQPWSNSNILSVCNVSGWAVHYANDEKNTSNKTQNVTATNKF